MFFFRLLTGGLAVGVQDLADDGLYSVRRRGNRNGERLLLPNRAADDPDIWFTSVESFAKVLSERNRELLALIVERQPEPLDALAEASGRAKSNLSRTLHTMARYGLVRLEKGAGRKLRPVVPFQKVELKLAVAA